VYDVASGETIVVGRGGGGSGIWWRPGTPTAAVSFDGNLALYDAEAGTWAVTDAPAPAYGAWSADGSYFALQDYNRKTHIFDVEGLRLTTTTLTAFPQEWSPDGRFFVGYLSDLLVALTKRERSNWHVTARTNAGGSWSPAGWLDDTTVLVRVRDRSDADLLAVNVETGSTQPFDLPGEDVPVTVRIDHGSGRLFALYARPEARLAVYQWPSLAPLHEIAGLVFPAWPPHDDEIIVTRNQCMADESVLAVNLATGEERVIGKIMDGKVISPDGRWLSFGGGTLALLDLHEGGEPRLVSDNHTTFSGGSWSSDSRRLGFVMNVRGHARCE
jgi:hypothetical protein